MSLKQLFLIVFITCLAQIAFSTESSLYDCIPNPESLKGITHYGMPIEEKVQTYRKDDAILEIIYPKDLSDDNMDAYVQRFYDNFLHLSEQRLYAGRLPANQVKIVISNCKFCKVGYCKTKNVKEITLTSYRNNVYYKKISFPHQSILDSNDSSRLARNAISLLID
jgi:hypothetical protein